MTTRRKLSQAAVTAIALAAVFMLTGVQPQAQPQTRDDQVRTFTVEFGPTGVRTAMTYDLGTVERNNKVLYVLKVTRHLTNDTSWIAALQAGMVFNPAIVRSYNSSLQLLTTYSLANATVSAVRQYGLSSDPFVTEEITLLSPSLSVTTP